MLCPQCRDVNADTANFCGNCGARLRPAGPPAQSAAVASSDAIVLDMAEQTPPSEGEHKLITALIVDIKDSVALIGSLDPEYAHRIVHAVLRIMVDSVRQFEGHVLQPTGDGIYAVFGAPRAFQDHAVRAVRAALEMQKRLRAYAENRREGDPLIEVRAGIESGQVVLRNLDIGQESVYITVGQTVNLAARLQSAAPPGSVVIGEQTRRLVDGHFELRSLPPATAKGVPHPIEINEVLGLASLHGRSQFSSRRPSTPFVGREAELQRLRDALLRAEGGQGQVVSVVAGAGVGKSRLLLEFRQTIPLGHKFVQAHGVSYARTTPWVPVIGMLQAYFEIVDSDNPAARRAKIESALHPLLPGFDQIRPFLFGLLGIVDGPDTLRQMDPAVKRDRIIEAISGIFLAASRNQALVLSFEDLHWIDDQTKLLLQRFASDIADSPILLLTNHRPEYVAGWDVPGRLTEIALEPLDQASTNHLLSLLLGDDAEVAELKRHIAERTNGNPFFMEETVNTLFQDGTLSRQTTVEVRKQIADLNVPMTVRGVLQERIDQIAPRQKSLLQILSVIGKDLPLELIFEVSEWPRAETMMVLTELQAADFIRLRVPANAGDNRLDYAFKHALTQEVAYQTMLVERQRLLHQRVARAIETVYAGFLNDQIALLAHHYDLARDYAKAIEYLGKAGQQAIQRAAHTDAIAFFRKALRLVELVPVGTIPLASQAVLWSSLGASLLVINGYSHAEVRQAYARAREICIATGDKANLVIVLRGTFLIHISSAEYAAALSTGRELLELGRSDETALLEGRVFLGVTSIYTGELQASDSWFSLALGLSNNTKEFVRFQHTGHTHTFCLAYHAMCRTYLGQIDRSLAESKDAQTAAEAIAVPITTAQTLAARGTNLHRLRYHDEAVACYDVAIDCATEHGIPYWTAFCVMAKAAIVAERDDIDAGLAAFDRALADYRRPGARLILSWFLYLRADMLGRAGRLYSALDSIAEAIAFIAETGEAVFEAEIYRLKGALLLQSTDSTLPSRSRDAEACFDRALTVARTLGTKLWELRAATSLACLRALEGRFADARDVLGPVYDSFTEGFQAPDLIDARMLLGFLAADGRSPFPVSDVPGSALLPP